MTKSVDVRTETVFVSRMMIAIAILLSVILLAALAAVIAVLRAEDNDDYDN